MQVLSAPSEIEISPVQGNARYGPGSPAGKEEGRGLRLQPKFPNQTPDPASCGSPAPPPVAGAASGPPLAPAPRAFRASGPGGTGDITALPTQGYCTE